VATDPEPRRLDADELKARLKRAAGALGNDDELAREGRIDSATSTARYGIDRVADKVKGLLRSDS
jgi:uncharacterized protein YjbJ (UPF0337 family)